MTEKKFTIESKSPLQQIGLRAQIVSFLLSQGVSEGNAVNDLGNDHRVMVAVRADSEQEIQAIRDELVQLLNRLHAQDPVSYAHFPADIHASELMELDNPHSLRLLSLNVLSDSLMLEQTSKGVGAIHGLTSAIKQLAATTAPIGPLAGAIERLGTKIDSLGNKVDHLH